MVEQRFFTMTRLRYRKRLRERVVKLEEEVTHKISMSVIKACFVMVGVEVVSILFVKYLFNL